MPSPFYFDTRPQPANWGAGGGRGDDDDARHAQSAPVSSSSSPLHPGLGSNTGKRRRGHRSARQRPEASGSAANGKGHNDDDDDDDNDDLEEGELDMETSFVFDVHGDQDALIDDDAPSTSATHGAPTAGGAPSNAPAMPHAVAGGAASAGGTGLTLPDHVQIIPDMPAAEAQREQREADDDMGNYDQLDLDPTTAGRYYAADENEEKRKLAKCPACGEEGHERKRCPHLLCMACGALDSHSTRECPLGTCCFRCGGQGHRSHDCNLPRNYSSGRGSRECVKCGSYRHTLATCPTHWRVYVFNDEHSYDVHRARQAYKRERGHRSVHLPARDEVEPEEVSDDESSTAGFSDAEALDYMDDLQSDWDPATRWCYNCGSTAHWGDDCTSRRVNPTRTNGEPSAFSEFVSRWGPYGARVPPPPPSHGGAGSAFDGDGAASYAFTFRSDVGGGSSRRGGDETTFHLSTAPPPSSRGRRDRDRPLIDRFANAPMTPGKRETKLSIAKKQKKKAEKRGRDESGRDPVNTKSSRKKSSGSTGGKFSSGKGKAKGDDGGGSKKRKKVKTEDGGEGSSKKKDKKEKKVKSATSSASSVTSVGGKKGKGGGGGGTGGPKVKVENKSMYRGGYD